MATTTAAIYLRLSADDGRAGESQSIETQRRECRRYCERHGWEPIELSAPDDGFSGSDPDLMRPGFEAVLSAMAGGEVQAVVAAKQDRIARNDKHWTEFRTTAELTGTIVHTVEAGDLGLGTDTGYLNTSMRNTFATFEARVIGSRTRSGLATSRANGRWTYSATFGYEKGGIIDPVEADWVRWAYEHILDGGSPMDVFTRLNAEGVLTSRGNKWTSVDRVIAMLKNPALAGLVTYKGEIVGPGAWEPIVTVNERDRLIATLKARSTGRKGHARKPARRYPLAGLALCGNPDCGKYMTAMIAHVPGKGRGHWYYCDPRRGGCKSRIRGEDLDTLGTTVALHFLNDVQAPKAEAVAWDDSEAEAVRTEIDEVRTMVASGALRASDGAPILRGLNERLDALTEAKAVHEARQVEAGQFAWHRHQQATLFDESDVFRLRPVLDNVVVLPDAAGFVFESKTGQVHAVSASEDGTWQVVGP